MSVDIPSDLRRVGHLKFEMLARGIRLSATAQEMLADVKYPIRTRSGASGGLDIILPNDVYVNAPLEENFAATSPLTLDVEGERFVVRRSGDVVSVADLQPMPAFYSRKTASGTAMQRIGQLCSGDRFCYGMTGPHCVFWDLAQQCRFCSIGLNRTRDASEKATSELLEVLAAAIADERIPAHHVLLGGGTPNIEDMGAVLASRLCRAIKKEFDISCYVMICAPRYDKYIDMLQDAGVDELGMNIEFWSEPAWSEYIPGKHAMIGKPRYLAALERAVQLFGPVNTRSLLVVGLEPAQKTLEGVSALASMGVMPILSPFRPLAGTPLESVGGFSSEQYFDIYEDALQRAAAFGIPVGPTCIPCQNNTLALPLPGSTYRHY